MNIEQWLNQTTLKFSDCSTTPRLDAEVLICDALSTNKAWLLAHPETPLQRSDLRELDDVVERRVAGEPVAYIRGKAEFYGRDFAVDTRVLVPRPESETMVDLLLGSRLITDSTDLHIVDVGTGSGALGITATLELQNRLPQNSVIKTTLIDIDQNSLAVAQANAKTYAVTASYRCGDLLEPIISDLSDKNTPLLILANLPYVPNNYAVSKSVAFEPATALYGGDDGLDMYRRLIAQLTQILDANVALELYTESLPSQHIQLHEIADASGLQLVRQQDLIILFSKK